MPEPEPRTAHSEAALQPADRHPAAPRHDARTDSVGRAGAGTQDWEAYPADVLTALLDG